MKAILSGSATCSNVCITSTMTRLKGWLDLVFSGLNIPAISACGGPITVSIGDPLANTERRDSRRLSKI
jgi:hypothetical protein